MKITYLKAIPIFVAIFAVVMNSSFAANPGKYYLKQDAVKSFYDKFFSEDYYKNFPETGDDPDLKLSIEELRKKYPIDWIEKKYGKIPDGCCKDFANPKKSTQCKKELVCGFASSNYIDTIDIEPTYYFLKRANLNDFSEKEIKSVLVNEIDLTKDSRAADLLGIILEELSYYEKPANSFKEKIRKFLYSPKIFLSALKNMDEENACRALASGGLTEQSYYRDLVFLFTLQKNIPQQRIGIKRYNREYEPFLIKRFYTIDPSKEFIEVTLNVEKVGPLLINCTNAKHDLKLAKEFEEKFLKEKYIKNLRLNSDNKPSKITE